MAGPAAEFRAERLRLLEAVLQEAAFEGWNGAAFLAAARSLGLTPALADNLFPGGMSEVLEFWHAVADERMVAALAAMDLSALRLPERIALAVRTHLEQNTEQREAVRAAMAYLAKPLHAPLALRCGYATVDAIWHAMGDRSTDFSFYTKRAMLAGLYAATALYWVNDRSPGSADTWAFLDRRLADLMRLPRATAELSRISARLPNPFRLLRPRPRRRRWGRAVPGSR
jgi:ubiquinone biosynthesis protein COQ9